MVKNYIETKLTVKTYLNYLDDMVKPKGQPQRARNHPWPENSIVDL